VLAETPGNFLVPRCRGWLTLARFCRREATATDFLQAIQQASAASHQLPVLSAWEALAQALVSASSTPEELWPTPDESLTCEHTRRRAAVEQAVRQLPPEQALPLLVRWVQGGEQDDTLREYAGWQMLRLLLLRTAASGAHGPRSPGVAEVLSAAR